MLVTIGQQYNVGEKPTVILNTKQKGGVVIIYDNSAVEPYTSRGLSQQPTAILYSYINRHAGHLCWV